MFKLFLRATFRSFLLVATLLTALGVNSASRVKDIADFEGVRDNMLIGYGIIVGLNGTGDNLSNSVFTRKGLFEYLERMGMNVHGAEISSKNIAAVMVTANLPPFARIGSKIDVSVSAIGDATSLKGGMLLATPLLGPDGNVYAMAQGQLTLGGFEALNESVKTNSKGVNTRGYVQNGAVIEDEIDFAMNSMTHIKLALRNPDFSTSHALANAINDNILGNTARALDPGTVEITVPNYKREEIVNFMAEIENLKIETDKTAKIVVDESSGTIVMGSNVSISPVAVAQGNLIVTIGGENQPARPAPDDERGSEMKILENPASLQDLVKGLNKLGVMPRDLINILKNIKASGALQAEIEVR